MMIKKGYKTITITHDIKKEYYVKYVLRHYKNSYLNYKEEILNRYKLAVEQKWCEILEINYDAIKIRMPKYEMDIERIKDLNEKLLDLKHRLIKIGIAHSDICFSNIGLDKNNNLQLIDLDSLSYNMEYLNDIDDLLIKN